MAIDSINSALAAQQKSGGATGASTRLADDFESFLLLLTTQLKNQDPTQPLDANDFTQQIVALSGVEQAIATNKHLEDMTTMFGQNQTATLVSYIGKQIETTGNKGYFDGSRVYFNYDLPQDGQDAEVIISDVTGGVVFSGHGSYNAGRNLVYWDGKNSFTGQQMPAGVYTVTVKAKDKGGQAMEAKTYTSGVVTSVETKDGVSQLMLGTIPIKLNDVTAIREAPISA